MKDNYFEALLNILWKVRPLKIEEDSTGWWPTVTLPQFGGVYALWWMNDSRFLKDKKNLVVKLLIDEKKRQYKPFLINTKMLDIVYEKPVPLYIGKTGNIADRVLRQLMLEMPRLPNVNVVTPDFHMRYSYFRQILDQIFPNHKDMRPLLAKHVAFSYVKLVGEENAFWRFYFKNYAIGNLRPICNLDVLELIA